MSSSLYRLGRWAFRARAKVLAVWLAVLAVIGAGAGLLGTGYDNTFTIPGTEAGDALEVLNHTFPQVAGSSAQLVVVAPDGGSVLDDQVRAAVGDAVAALGDVDQVEAVADPYGELAAGAISADQSAVLVTAQLDANVADVPQSTLDALVQVETDLKAALPQGATAAIGGSLFSVTLPTVSASEGLGVLVALVVLLVTFGSFVAAGLPLVTALLGVAVSLAGITLATRFATVSATTPLLALMLGLAVGIDYTLFIVSRHQSQVRAGMAAEESAARALATAGSAVVFAGLTVMIALVGLAVAQIPFLTVMGVAAAVAVGIAVVIALTLTPALLGFVGDRLTRPRRRGRAVRAADGPAPTAAHGPAGHGTAPTGPAGLPVPANRFFLGWVRAVTRWPVVTILLVVLGLGVVALPALDLKLALPDGSSQPRDSRARTTYDLIADHFGPGYNGPLIVMSTIVGSTDPLGLMADLKNEIEALPGVAAVPVSTPNLDATVGIVQVVPEGGPHSQETADLVATLRGMHQHFADTYGLDTSVTGITAVQIDISAKLGAALLPFAAFVVGLSFVLLTMVFRSLWVPVKATAGYLLSVAASFGVVAMVFERGWGAALLGIEETGPVISFMPIVLMGVLFGLAMDYEVFLVARMREEYVHGGDARAAIRTGFVGSAKVVTAAAVIMFSVFSAFVPEGSLEIKPIALGLAAGVFVDAFIVRMTLVPAVLQLLGDRAWHMPRALERVLPSFDVEGEGLATELRLVGTARPDEAVHGTGLRLDAPDGTPVYRDVDLSVARGGVLVVAGPHRSGRTALLLTLAGRAHADAGTLVVDGLVAPVRARDIRHRVAFARLARVADPGHEIRLAFAARTPVVVVDDLDTVTDPERRRAVHAELAQRLSAPDRPTLVVSCLDHDQLRGLLPVPPTAVVTLSATPSPVKVG